ncbi:hypothetical protein [Nocardia testacea]|uniref:hypothetical protein n=1 Tax=Nocardia testacea TaxID=248551 RepID=UPI0033FA1E04
MRPSSKARSSSRFGWRAELLRGSDRFRRLDRIRMPRVMVEMPELLMPDQNAPGYPDEFKFSPLIESYYRGLPRALRGYWDAFGSGSVADMPLKPAIRGVEGTASARIRNYEAVAAQLERRFQDLQEMDRRMADLVRRSLAATRAGRERVEAAIQRINADAGTIPIGKSKGDHILDYAPAGLDRADRAVVDTTRAHQEQARISRELVRRLVEMTPSPQSAPAIPMLFAPDPAPAHALAPGATAHDRSRGPANGSGAGEAPVPREHRGTAASHPTDSVAAPSAESVPHATTDIRRSSAQEPGPAPRDSLLGTVAGTTGRADRDPSTVGETASAAPEASTGGRSVVSSMLSAGGNSTPWSSRTGAPPASDQARAAFRGKLSEAGPMGRQQASPTEDASMVYVLPDGRTQYVSPVVAEILDTAFGRRPATNTRPASTGSPNAVSAGIRRETDSVRTGDLAVWARGSAVVVVFGTADKRSYEVIIDGRLQPLSDGFGEVPEVFGPFTGFGRLHGPGSDAGVAGPPVKEGQPPRSGSGERRQVGTAVPARTQRYRAPGTVRGSGAVSAKRPADGEGAVVNG